MAITTTITPLDDDLLKLAAQGYLQQAQSNALAGVDASLAASQVGYTNAVADTNAAYDNIARQAYANYQTGQKGMANQLASAGLYNSGYADTLRVQQANQYASNLNASEIERAKTLRDLSAEQEANRLNAEAQKLDINAQYAQMLANQANADRDYLFSEKQYADSRADVMWEREQYLKEADNAAQQQLISNAYAAAELGDFSQLEALGINTTAAKAAYEQAQRATLLDEAYAAAEVGDFSYLKALGIDTTDLERLWNAELTASLYGGYGGGSGGGSGSGSSSVGTGSGKVGIAEDYDITNSQYAQATDLATKLVNNMLGQGKSWSEIFAYAESLKNGLSKQFGADFYKAYYDVISGLYYNGIPEEEPPTENDVYAELARFGINSRAEALDWASDLSGKAYSAAVAAIDKRWPLSSGYGGWSLSNAKSYINDRIKNSRNPLTEGKALITQMIAEGLEAGYRVSLFRWLEEEY